MSSNFQLLASIRAGLLNRQDGIMVADPRKGLLRIVRDHETTMVHFEWGARGADGNLQGDPEISFIIFPGEATFKQMAVPGARAFELVFEDTTRPPYFFWAQEPKADQDAGHAASIEEAINNPPELMEMEEGPPEIHAGPSTSHDPSQPPPAKKPLIDPSTIAALQQALGGSSGGVSNLGFMEKMLALAKQRGIRGHSGPGLTDIFKSDVLKELFSDPDIRPKLLPLLPKEHQNVEQLMALAQSPQLQAQLSNLSHALETGEIDPLQFGVNPTGPGVKAFLEALEKKAREGNGGGKQ